MPDNILSLPERNYNYNGKHHPDDGPVIQKWKSNMRTRPLRVLDWTTGDGLCTVQDTLTLEIFEGIPVADLKLISYPKWTYPS